uniref:LPS export ABC transporter periplasmic protein LptC n=1 Tax=Eiseniibacteriota bacterium TaxID=2212470 RepID=A0A832I1U4_UNCEI
MLNRVSHRHIRGLRPAPATVRRAALAALAALALALPALTGCGRQRTAGPGPASGELPDQEVRDFVLTETHEGAVQWVLYARWAAMFDARNQILARSIRVDFFGADGARTSELTAREGEINQLTKDMTATGNVVLRTTEGTRMTTEQLRFLNAKQRVVSDGLVRVDRGGDVLTGVGFESDPELRHFEFKRRVQATVRTRSGGVLAPGEERR